MQQEYNIHHSIYRGLERSVLSLTEVILIDDKQLSTYSAAITSLILNTVVEIEAISLELYYKEGGTKKKLSYKTSLEFLNDKKFRLEDICAIISFDNCFLSAGSRVVMPFRGWNNKEKTNSDNVVIQKAGWGYAYQALKHNETKNKYTAVQTYGTMEILLNALAALCILNFCFSGNGKIIDSDLFDIAVVEDHNDSDNYVVWKRSASFMRKKLPEDIIQVIRNKRARL